jgi:hypothetical protein
VAETKTTWQTQRDAMLDAQARRHAEVSRLKFRAVKAKQLALVREERRTKRQAVDSMRKAYEKIRATYLRVPCTTYDAWDEHGPKRDWDECIAASADDAVWDRLVETFELRTGGVL